MDRKILSLQFNQDYGCFSCSMETGMRIYNVNPLCEKADFDYRITGSVALCSMIYRTNILALVGGGHRPMWPSNRLMFFDAENKEFLSQVTFKAPIQAIRMRRDKFAVSLTHVVYVMSYPAGKTIAMLDVRDNSRGLLEMTAASICEREIVVFPGCKIGSLQIVDISNTESVSTTPALIECHTGELSCICLNQEGTKVATASDQGTIIRVWDTNTKQQLLELGRGCEAAQIYSLAFNLTSEYLCCSSDKGTVHIFAINNAKLNRRMIFGSLLGRFGGPMKSFATFQVPPECPCLCAFSSSNSVVAIGMDGSFNKYTFTVEGHCARVACDVFIDLVGDSHYF